MDRARVARGRVVVRVFRRDREIEGAARRGAGGALTTKCVAAAAATFTAPLLPAIEPLAVSVAVTVWLPAVFSVALNVPTPLVSVALAGRAAAASLLLKWTVPA